MMCIQLACVAGVLHEVSYIVLKSYHTPPFTEKRTLILRPDRRLITAKFTVNFTVKRMRCVRRSAGGGVKCV